MSNGPIDIALWLLALILAWRVWARGRETLIESVRKGLADFGHLIPRFLVGITGSGFIAAALPQDVMSQWLGPQSGVLGIAVATLAGSLTPGGPVVGFAIGAAALKGGAGAPQVIAYATAWALFAFQRLLVFEIPMMPAYAVWLRVIVSLPVPFFAAWAAMLLGKP